jgi:hypothetical protein
MLLGLWLLSSVVMGALAAVVADMVHASEAGGDEAAIVALDAGMVATIKTVRWALVIALFGRVLGGLFLWPTDRHMSGAARPAPQLAHPLVGGQG